MTPFGQYVSVLLELRSQREPPRAERGRAWRSVERTGAVKSKYAWAQKVIQRHAEKEYYSMTLIARGMGISIWRAAEVLKNLGLARSVPGDGKLIPMGESLEHSRRQAGYLFWDRAWVEEKLALKEVKQGRSISAYPQEKQGRLSLSGASHD